ncbi:hypothetical protein [Streptomyces sp. cmx-4-9]|uniref:hypothetical protein n=1 Tax=Streptomyces sp. cmx-4-9 TaxID=2790941 RepID=UPI00397F100E
MTSSHPAALDPAALDPAALDPAALDPADMTWPPPPYRPPVAPVTDAHGVRRFDGATYATTPGYRPRLLDVQVPAGDVPFPAVVWIHGGGWLDGDRRYPPPTVPAALLHGAVLGAGLALVSIDYRHSLGGTVPSPTARCEVATPFR